MYGPCQRERHRLRAEPQLGRRAGGEAFRGRHLRLARITQASCRSERARHQELFIRDEIRVMCATIAFGMGIDKPNVRYVVHYDLPKNVEGYYQETGRAGRDGLASDCALFFSGGDAAKQRHFIRQIENPQEREKAERLLRQMLDFAATTSCRRSHLLRYFGEDAVADQCGNCDNCLQPPERVDGTQVARKLLSCIYRVREHSGFSSGAHHIVDVLLGKRTEKVDRVGARSPIDLRNRCRAQ